MLPTDLYIFPEAVGGGNFFKDQCIFSLVIIFLILLTLSLENVMMLREFNVGLLLWLINDLCPAQYAFFYLSTVLNTGKL